MQIEARRTSVLGTRNVTRKIAGSKANLDKPLI
jgi:hypothetical protein